MGHGTSGALWAPGPVILLSPPNLIGVVWELSGRLPTYKLKGMDWGPQVGNPKNIVGIEQESVYLGSYVPIDSYHILGGPKDHINTRISHSGCKNQYKGIPETMVGRILVFMWSYGALGVPYLGSLRFTPFTNYSPARGPEG